MAASSLEAEEKGKLAMQVQREKYQAELEKLEKEVAELKVWKRVLLIVETHSRVRLRLEQG